MNPLILALVPQLLEWATKIVAAFRADPGTPVEQQAKLDKLSADLKQCEIDVAAVELPNKA